MEAMNAHTHVRYEPKKHELVIDLNKECLNHNEERSQTGCGTINV